MADVNGSSEENAVKTEESVDKVDVNGGGDNDGDKPVEDKKVPDTQIEMDPELRAKKIKRQIEYYFGDYNLPTDKFLRTQVKEKDGWVPLEILLKFKRLASLTQDPAVIAAALDGSQLIQISEDKTEVRRHPDKPLPEENEARRKEVLTRTVYVKGFPQEGFTIDNALDFFEQYGPTDDVVMRFWQDKAAKTWNFKGSMFIKFPNKDAAAAFLAIDEVKYEDTPIIKMWQEDYLEQKRKERIENKLQKRNRPPGEEPVMEECEGGILKLSSGLEVEVKPLEGEEEETFLKNAQTSIRARRSNKGGGGKQRGGRRGGDRGGGRGGGGNWRKRKNENSDQPQAKMVKTDGDSGNDGD